MPIAVASFNAMPAEFADNDLLMERIAAAGIEAEMHAWDDPAVDWDGFDLIVARSPWDYTFRIDEFFAWLDRVEGKVENSAAIIRWNADKRYLADLAEAGVPVVETHYVEPYGEIPSINSPVVVKPTISAGGRDTGRFDAGSAATGEALIAHIGSLGKTAMVQPFIESVDQAGETACVMFDGKLSHVLRKGAVLKPDEVAPIRDDGLAAAEAMYDPELVGAGTATPEQVALAERVIEAVAERFGSTPLCARVDMLTDDDGQPILLELEAIEPNLYLEHSPDATAAADRLVSAIADRL